MKRFGVMLLLAGTLPGYAAAQIAEYGPAQLARQAVNIRTPYLAQMAQVQYAAAALRPAAVRAVPTTFKRSSGWFKPWSMANEIRPATDDLAVTYGHTIALNAELGTGNRMSASEEAALRGRLQAEFARSPLYWTDADKQSVHETLVITTMLALAGYANAIRDDDRRALVMFREAGRKNVTMLTNATLIELRNARSALNGD